MPSGTTRGAAVRRLREAFSIIVSSLAAVGCGDAALGPASSGPSTIDIPADSLTLLTGALHRLTAIVRDNRGVAMSRVAVDWSTDAVSVVEVDTEGKLEARSPGRATVSATVAGSHGNRLADAAVVVVTAGGTVEIAPSSHTLTAIGQAVQLTATARDAAGSRVGDARIAWSSPDAHIVTLNETGEVIGKAAGVALILAAWEAAVDTAFVEVRQSVDRVAIAPATADVVEGETVQLTATFFDASGHIIAGVAAQWSTQDASVAAISGAGVVRGVVAGSTVVAATAGQATGIARITVHADSGVLAKSAGAFVNSIGINTHISYLDRVYGDGFQSIIKPRLKELGVRHLRDGGRVWPDEGWMSLVYGRYRELAEVTGARFTIIMGPAGTAAGTGTDFADARHLRELLDRIGWDNVAAFEGLNEHDWFGNDANWAANVRAFQRALYEQVKADPQLASRYPVLGPSLARADNAMQVGDLSAFMDHPVMHPYPGGREPRHDFDLNVQTLRPMNGTAPPMATETGYHTAALYSGGHAGVSERAMGKYVPRLFLEYFAAGVVRTFAYELIDQGTDPADHEMNFGLLRVDGSEKPAFRSLRTLVALLDDPGATFTPGRLGYAIEGDTSGLRSLLFQKRDGRFYLVLWQSVSSYDVQRRKDIEPAGRSLTVRLDRAAQRIRLHEPFLGSAPTAEFSGKAVLSVVVHDHPLVIEVLR